MKTRTILAAVTVTAALAGCAGGSSGHHASCPAQYHAWRTGPARPVAKTLANDITNLDFKGAVQPAQQLESMPMPACADPAGYWQQLLKKIVAIGNNESAGLGYIMAQAQDISSLETKIDNELKKTVPGEVS